MDQSRAYYARDGRDIYLGVVQAGTLKRQHFMPCMVTIIPNNSIFSEQLPHPREGTLQGVELEFVYLIRKDIQNDDQVCFELVFVDDGRLLELEIPFRHFDKFALYHIFKGFLLALEETLDFHVPVGQHDLRRNCIYLQYNIFIDSARELIVRVLILHDCIFCLGFPFEIPDGF